MSSGSGTLSIVAVDTGGTFTDIVAWTAAGVRVLKVPSTPDDPARAVLDGVRAILDGAPAALLIHGSTVATNALLERAGARAALITNRGFEDVLVLGRQTRPQLYALAGTRPPPLVPDELRLGVGGRIAADGSELAPLDEADVARIIDALRAAHVEAVAICMLHSYANDAHERAIAAALQPLGLPVSVSSELLPEYREYERTATTVVNAYVAPKMDRYLARIEREAGAARVRIMGSGGGAVGVDRARREPAHTILSGPAGGVAGALRVAARQGIRDIMTFDMGGTSTDVALCPGRALHTREFTIAGVPVALPVLDIHTVGAGGGSIARVDAGGALRVGPESAGAVPGPVCYGRGGTQITVTDANAALGRLIPGEHGLRFDAAAIAAPLHELARSLGMDGEDAAEGVIAVVDTAMEGALRVISVDRGYDPADFTLVPFGGAAGLHAVSLAERLGIPRILVPPAPGVLSAFGMLVAPVRKDVARSVLLAGIVPHDVALDEPFRELETRALDAMRDEGIPTADVVLRRTVAARYRGQSWELDVPADDWIAAFHAAHEQRFGYRRDGEPVEAVTLRVEASAPGIDVPPPRALAADAAAPTPGEARVRWNGRHVAAARYVRETLPHDHRIDGPAVVLERTAALWLPPDWSAAVLMDASLLLERRGTESAS